MRKYLFISSIFALILLSFAGSRFAKAGANLNAFPPDRAVCMNAAGQVYGSTADLKCFPGDIIIRGPISSPTPFFSPGVNPATAQNPVAQMPPTSVMPTPIVQTPVPPQPATNFIAPDTGPGNFPTKRAVLFASILTAVFTGWKLRKKIKKVFLSRALHVVNNH